MTAGRTVNTNSQHWCTPLKYLIPINQMFDDNIELDPCSNQWDIVKAKNKFIYPLQNGLMEKWNFKTIYVNPPYGKDKIQKTSIKNWLYKCYMANKLFESEVLALVPVASNTSHWKESVWNKATGICFLYDTRLKFIQPDVQIDKGAPMACSIIYWGKYYQKFFDIFIQYGAVVNLNDLYEKIIGQYHQQQKKIIKD